MPIGILSSGLIGEVASPSKVLVMLPSGLRGEAAWGTAKALQLLVGGMVGEAAAAAGIVPVGSKSTAKTFVFATGAGQPAQSMPCTLPAGCMVGDTVVLTCNGISPELCIWDGPTGAAAVTPNTVYYGVGPYRFFAYKLTSADISAGMVACSVSLSGSTGATMPSTVVVDAYRAVADSAIDVVGALTFGPETLATSGATSCIAPGITTTADADMLQYVLLTAATASGTTFTLPAGWGAGDAAADGSVIVRTAHSAQTSAGATGDITAQLSGTFPASTNYKALLISLRKADTTFRLLGTLPRGNVGTAWTGTLTFAGDFTGPITFTGLPEWMGEPAIDYTAKTATWSGTPDTAETETFTPVATDAGGKVAPGSEQSVVIAAAASGFTDDFSNPTTSAANWAMSLQGTAGGTYAFNAGSCVLTPKSSAQNSVAMRHTGPFTSVAMTAARAANPGTVDYLSLSLGTGGVATYNNDGSSWQITVIKYGYALIVRTPGNVTLYRCNGSGANTTLATKTYTDSTPYAAHTYQLTATGSGVTVTRDGVTLITSSDTTYSTGGDILIAQGEYTTGVGGIATLTQVTAS